MSKLLFFSTAGIFLGEHQWSCSQELGTFLETAILWQQGPVYFGRLLHSYIAKLHDYGGKFASQIVKNNTALNSNMRRNKR